MNMMGVPKIKGTILRVPPSNIQGFRDRILCEARMQSTLCDGAHVSFGDPSELETLVLRGLDLGFRV